MSKQWWAEGRGRCGRGKELGLSVAGGRAVSSLFSVGSIVAFSLSDAAYLETRTLRPWPPPIPFHV